MNNSLERRVRDDGLVESILLGNIFDNGEVKLVRLEAGVSLLNLVGLCLGANSGDDTVATLEEDVEDVGGDKARASGEKYASHYELVMVGIWYYESEEVLVSTVIVIYLTCAYYMVRSLRLRVPSMWIKLRMMQCNCRSRRKRVQCWPQKEVGMLIRTNDPAIQHTNNATCAIPYAHPESEHRAALSV